MVKNIKLVLAYDGSKFSGWQSQENKRTVQGCLEDAVEKVTGRKSRIVCAGRTDAGVHAYGQVANFLTISRILGHALVYHLNKYLDDDILIISSEEVDLDFHARFSAHKKKYRYVVFNDKLMYPTENNYAGYCREKLDLERMKEAALYLLGKHDFKAFMKYDKPVNTVRNIESIDIYKDGPRVIFEFSGESFLYNQVRIMVGTLTNIGRGLWSVERMKDILDSRDRLKAGMTYPAGGLYLLDISY